MAADHARGRKRNIKVGPTPLDLILSAAPTADDRARVRELVLRRCPEPCDAAAVLAALGLQPPEE